MPVLYNVTSIFSRMIPDMWVDDLLQLAALFLDIITFLHSLLAEGRSSQEKVGIPRVVQLIEFQFWSQSWLQKIRKTAHKTTYVQYVVYNVAATYAFAPEVQTPPLCQYNQYSLGYKHIISHDN